MYRYIWHNFARQPSSYGILINHPNRSAFRVLLYGLLVSVILAALLGMLSFALLRWVGMPLPNQGLATLLPLSLYIAELALLCLLATLRPSDELASHFAKWLLIIGFLAIWMTQFISLRLANQFISPIIWGNRGAISALVSTETLLLFASSVILTSGIGLGVFCLSKSISAPSRKRDVFRIANLFVVAGALSAVLAPSPSNTLPAEGRSPVFALASLALGAYRTEIPRQQRFSEGELATFGMRVKNGPYPMTNDRYYVGSAPFQAQFDSSRRPNVIVFFVESLSTRKLSLGVTPNLLRFADEAMSVEGYYNHTQSTFRGLRGQLCSMFPYHVSNVSPFQTEYNCLPHHFNTRGYQTVFFGPDHPHHQDFEDQTKSMGFSKNLYRDFIRTRLLENEELTGGFLSDRQLMSGLLALLGDQERTQEPFFIATYFKGAHLGQDVRPKERRMGDGANRVLNTLHNFDHEFGNFLDWLEHSPLKQNTIVIVTADHAHWPEEKYIELVGPSYQWHPVDEIALIISSELHDLPSTYDATVSTSLGFAPMVAQLLGWQHLQNAFIGLSPLSDGKVGEAIAWFNNSFYAIDRNKKIFEYNVTAGDLPERYQNVWKAISTTHDAELNDRIVPPGRVEPQLLGRVDSSKSPAADSSARATMR